MGRNGVDISTDDVESMKDDVVARLREFIENEMRSCSMDIGGITPEYVKRAWGGRVDIEDIEAAFEELKRSDDFLYSKRSIIRVWE